MRCPMCGYGFESDPSTIYCPSCGQRLPTGEPNKVVDPSVDITLGPPRPHDEEEPRELPTAEAAPNAQAESETEPPEPARAGIPWEDENEPGLIRAFFRTVRLVLLRPTQFFLAMPLRGGYRNPLAFGIAAGWITLLVFVVLAVVVASVGSLQNEAAAQDFSIPGVLVAVAFILVLSPLFLAVMLFICAGFRHLFVMLLAPQPVAFEATFRVVAYAQSTRLLRLAFILCCGNVVDGIWSWCAQTIGLKQAHGLTSGRAFLAVLPSVILTVLVWLIATWIVAMSFAAGVCEGFHGTGCPL